MRRCPNGMGAPPSASPMDDGEDVGAGATADCATVAAGPVAAAAARRWCPGGLGGPKASRGPLLPPRPLPCEAAPRPMSAARPPPVPWGGACGAAAAPPVAAASPPPVPWGSACSAEQPLFQATRKRPVAVVPPSKPCLSFGGSSRLGGGVDEGVAALLPKMKRMRLRPSLGQLRLQREADDTNALAPQVRICVEPEQLRAAATISAADGGCAGGWDLIELELSFPPQYPHRPPQVVQLSPMRHLPAWQYDGSFVLLARLTERCWSSAMGVVDILRDLVESLSRPPGVGGAGVGGCCQGMASMCGRPPSLQLPSPQLPSPDDVEMA